MCNFSKQTLLTISYFLSIHYENNRYGILLNKKMYIVNYCPKGEIVLQKKFRSSVNLYKKNTFFQDTKTSHLCDICDVEMPNGRGLKRHIQEQHPHTPFCRKCCLIFQVENPAKNLGEISLI